MGFIIKDDKPDYLARVLELEQIGNLELEDGQYKSAIEAYKKAIECYRKYINMDLAGKEIK